MPSTYRLQEQITALMLAGATLERVEREVIDPSNVSEDRKAALWLYALSFVDGVEQRAQADSFLRAVR